MLDIDLIREQTEWVRQQLRNLNDEGALQHVDAALQLDEKRRALITQVQQIKEARNVFSKGAGRLKGDKKLDDGVRIAAAVAVAEAVRAGNIEQGMAYINDPANAPSTPKTDTNAALDDLFAELKTLGDRASTIDEQIREVENDLTAHMAWIPNMPHPDVKVGASDAENIIHEAQGQMPNFNFTPQPHWELGPALDLIDFERGVKLAGSRFYIIKNQGARLYRALINWMIDEHIQRGFEELYLPFMVKEDALFGAGQLPKFEDVVYSDPEAELYMLPTAEVAMTYMFADEILEEADLPYHFVAHTPCFRREKMSAGRDVRGIKRVHQFEKVELYKITTPETSYDEMEGLLQAAENVVRGLNIPYRRVEQVTGDLGFHAARKFDLEMYAPGCDEWLEVSSVSNVEAFQARRCNLRYRPAEGGKPRYVHTLNGSGLGMTRALIAVMENYQLADGSIRVPEVLVPYMGGLDVIEPREG
jgi:seryl-tRNA synthetase